MDVNLTTLRGKTIGSVDLPGGIVAIAVSNQ
jgi:hypothetical protein